MNDGGEEAKQRFYLRDPKTPLDRIPLGYHPDGEGYAGRLAATQSNIPELEYGQLH